MCAKCLTIGHIDVECKSKCGNITASTIKVSSQDKGKSIAMINEFEVLDVHDTLPI